MKKFGFYFSIVMISMALFSVVVTSQDSLTWEGILPSIFNSTSSSINISLVGSDAGLDISEETALTNTVNNIFTMTHTTSGTPAANIGVGIDYIQETSAANNETVMSLDAVIDDATATSEDASFSVKLMAAGAAKAEKFAVESTGVVTLVNGGTIDNSTNGIVTIGEPSSATNTVVDIAKVSHTTSGTPANNIGVGVALEVETSASNNEVGATIDAVALDTTATSEDFSIILSTMAAGAAAAERVEISSTAVELSTALDLNACTIAADDTTPDVTGCTWLTTSANSGATAITDLDNPVVGALYCIIGGSATNSSTIADSGNFALSGAFTAGLDDVLCLYVQADNDYIEISVSDN